MPHAGSLSEPPPMRISKDGRASDALELRTYLAILRRRLLLIVGTLVTAVIVTVVGTALLPRTYDATATVRITTADEAADRTSYDSVMYAGRLTNTYAKIVTSGSVLDELAARLGQTETPKVKVEVPPNTELMQITVEHRDAVKAAEAANALTEILIARAKDVTAESTQRARGLLDDRLSQLGAEIERARAADLAAGGDTAASRRARELQEERYARLLDQIDRLQATDASRGITVTERASVPLAPSRPRMTLNLAIAAALGLVGGLGLAFLVEHLDTRLHSVGRIAEVTGRPILGAVPTSPGRTERALFAADAPETDALRRVRTHLLAGERGTHRTLLVTSAEPGEGKSTVVANLALVLAEANRRVVVVDADLRRPTVHTVFGLPNGAGLSAVLGHGGSWDQVIQETGRPNVWAITSGRPVTNPTDLLGGPRMAELVQSLAGWFDLVLIDTPSVLAVADATQLAATVGNVVLVVGCGQTVEESVRTTCAELAGVQAAPVGVIVNRARPGGWYRYYQAAGHDLADLTEVVKGRQGSQHAAF
jgi:polysaccharide biosynthesis transport protein